MRPGSGSSSASSPIGPPVTQDVALEWGRLSAGNPPPVIDGLIAATALVHGLTVVTRNVADFEPTGVPLLNPFAA